MSASLQTTDNASKIEQVLMGGDLAPLSTNERVVYYNRVCESLGLNPLTKPFDFIKLNGKLTLYARKDATDQLRKLHKVSIDDVKTEKIGDIYQVTVKASLNGRTDTDVGVLSVAGLKGADLSNALMKCLTKAKRRVTLSICGLGILDETEAEDVQNKSSEAKAAEARLLGEAKPEPEPENEPASSPEPQDAEYETEEVVQARCAPSNVELRKKLKSLGFKWNPTEKVWEKPIDYDEVDSYDFEFEVIEKSNTKGVE